MPVQFQNRFLSFFKSFLHVMRSGWELSIYMPLLVLFRALIETFFSLIRSDKQHKRFVRSLLHPGLCFNESLLSPLRSAYEVGSRVKPLNREEWTFPRSHHHLLRLILLVEEPEKSCWDRNSFETFQKFFSHFNFAIQANRLQRCLHFVGDDRFVHCNFRFEL